MTHPVISGKRFPTSLLAGLLLSGCSGDPVIEKTATPSGWFEEIAETSGLRFVHENGMSGEFYMAENVGPGAALCDLDNDGDLDIFLPQGVMLDPAVAADTAPVDRIYRNDLAAPGEQPRFTDVTAESGWDDGGYAMGVACADFDGDGLRDLYVTHLRADRLYRNLGELKFQDITGQSGIDNPAWGVSAAAIDLNADTLPDLFVGNYLNWTLSLDKDCLGPSGLEDYCAPDSYQPLPDRYYQNIGNGRFRDQSRTSGISGKAGAALGIVGTDANLDGRLDVYVANDGLPNHLWLGDAEGNYSEEALLAGCALNRDGMAEASMGVDAADIDGDGDEDLVMVHLHGETNTVYENLGSGIFEDASSRSGLGAPSAGFTGFGAGWRDFNGDGNLDLFVANGAVRTIAEQQAAGSPYPLRERNQLFVGLGDGTFRERLPAEEPSLRSEDVSRGTAFGDIDEDGDVDILIVNSAGPVHLLLNRIADGNRWLGVRPVWGNPPRDALGAWVNCPGSPNTGRRIRSDGSFASSNDPRARFALPGSDPGLIEIYWPDGIHERFSELSANSYHTLRYGTGEVLP